MANLSVWWDVLQKRTISYVMGEFGLMMLLVQLWIAVVVGVLVGWAWKPKWANLKSSSVSDSKNSSLCFSKLSGCFSCLHAMVMQLSTFMFWTNNETSSVSDVTNGNLNVSEVENDKSECVGERDLLHLSMLVEEKDGGPAWIQMMDRTTKSMKYQAWRRDPENGPPQYRSRTIYEDATPETVRDFFWDDEFRLKWDDMVIHAATIQESPATGTMVVHWVRKFPFFCSDREYVIGRRIWKSGETYYCITKGVPCSSVPRHDKPRRVDLFYFSWCIHPAESRRGDGQLTACEVLLFHHEDMGIPWEIAKFGVRKGMWGAVKNIEAGLRAYQKEKANGLPLSHCASMAHINTVISDRYLKSLEDTVGNSSEIISDSSEKPQGGNFTKLLVVSGAIVLACSVDQGLLTKAVIFGIARRFMRFGRR